VSEILNSRIVLLEIRTSTEVHGIPEVILMGLE
jgi:hypothetical protein